MAKEVEEIKELLKTDLFQKGLTSGYISINDDYTRITYNCKNKTSRNFLNPEESVQAAAYLKLILDYNYSSKNIAVNETVKVGSEDKEADIIVYNTTHEKILIVVECKEEGINERQFQIAIDQAYSYAHARASKYIWVTSGVKDEYYEIVEQYPLRRISISDIPQKGGEIKKCRYIKGENDPQKGTQGLLKQKFKSAHDALWGGGALAPTTAFDELDKLIFCKVWDERWEENDPESAGKPYNFQIIYYSDDEKNVRAKEELEKRIKKLYEFGRKKDPNVFREDIKLDRNKIFTVVQYLQDINLSETDLDAKGFAFQSFISDFFRGDFGQYFTPNNIVKFIVDSLNITNDMKILDTSCGSGGFLLHALKKVREKADKIYTDKKSYKWHDYWHKFAQDNLYGIEINEQISRVAKMNMIIHDDGHTNVITNDGLKSNKIIKEENNHLKFTDGTFDLIMTNPPFGSSIKASESKHYKEYELFEKNLGYKELKDRIEDDNNKNKWRTSQNTEVLFLERCYNYLKEGGFLAIVLPDGILTNSTLQYVRDWLCDKFRIISVVSLPQTTFSHVKAGVKSSILFLKKHDKEITMKFEEALKDIKNTINNSDIPKDNRPDKIVELYKEKVFKIIDNYEVLMLEIENVGYEANGKEIEGNELPDAAERINNFIKSEVF